MTHDEKAEMLKNSIEQLYSKEGRTISYIARLLDIDRSRLSKKIHEWGLPKAEPHRYLKPSSLKFLNKNRNLIKSRLDNDVSISDIARELKLSRSNLVRTFIQNDEVLTKAYSDHNHRAKQNHIDSIESQKSDSKLEYDFEDLPNEQWKPILGYPRHYVSNMGRIKSYKKRYDSYVLLSQQPNKNNDRPYIRITNSNGKSKNLAVARVVAHAFCNGFDETHNTVNHKDGNVMNNKADNLEWTSQSENNLHAYSKLNRTKVNFKRYKFDRIIYKEKYEFKTVTAFARFIGKSETQTRRYLDNPEKHGIKLVNNCND